MSQTSIEWTDVTWNPTRGCSRISEGCRNCYAERVASRFIGGGHALDDAPFAGFAIRTEAGPRWTGRVQLIPEKLEEPLHWKRPRRVFVNSMSDLFHEALPDEAIDRVFAVMALCPQHTFQILTKRAERMLSYFRMPGLGLRQECIMLRAEYESGLNRYPNLIPRWPLPLPNVWLGVSVEDDSQQQRIRELVKTPAAIRFISYEPALGPLGLKWALPKIQWVICGGESGPGARPFDICWARSARDQCAAAGVPFFMKQLGAKPVDKASTWNRSMGTGISTYKRINSTQVRLVLSDRKGGSMEEWPQDLRMRQFPVTERSAVLP